MLECLLRQDGRDACWYLAFKNPLAIQIWVIVTQRFLVVNCLKELHFLS